MYISKVGLKLIKEFEGLKLEAYKCPAGIWTIGYGHTHNVREGDRIDEARADELIIEDIWYIERGVESLVHVPLTQGQFDSLVSFAYNVGTDIDEDLIPEGLGDSTLLRKLNNGDYAGAADEFPKWNKSKGKVLPGLVRRRKAERDLFLS